MEWREAYGIRLARWAAAIAIVAGIHVCAAYSILWQPEAADDEQEGVFVLELSPMTTSVQAMTHAFAPGQESEDSVEVPAAKQDEQPVVQKSPEVPPLPKVQDAPEELLLPEKLSEQLRKETPEPEKEQDHRQQPTEASRASVAARPLHIEDAAAAKKTAAPMAGVAERDTRTKAKWHRDLVAHLGRFKRYPATAASRRETGEIVLKFVLDRTGRVTAASVFRSSGSPSLDEAALDMVMRASPLPPPPNEVPGETIELLAPVRFHIRG